MSRKICINTYEFLCYPVSFPGYAVQDHEDGYELHRLLGALLSKELTVDEKLTIMDTEYNGLTPQQIADATDKKLEEVERIIKGREPAMA